MQSSAHRSIKSLQSSFSRYMDYIKNSDVIYKTDLVYNQRLSKKYGCNLFLKREDLQSVRSFKVEIANVYISCSELSVSTSLRFAEHIAK